MNDETVRPALTPEEWKGADDIELGCDLWWRRASDPDGPLLITEAGLSALEVDRPQTLAALALHGQPFGFTREDVELLRNSSERYYELLMERGEDTPHFARKQAFMFRSLADRIAALLPPEDPNG